MIPRKRPTSCLIFGILNLVFGSLLLLFYLCCSVGLFGVYFMFQAMERAIANDRSIPAQQKKEFQDLFGGLIDIGREFAPFMITVFAVGFVLAMVWAISGIGLVRVKQWGRWWSVAWGIVFIAFLIGREFWTIAYVYPAIYQVAPKLEKIMQEIEEGQRARGQVPPPRQRLDAIGGSGNAIADNALGLGFATLQAAYALLLIVWMALPQTGQAIREYNRKQGEGEGDGLADQQGALYDDEYERQRRRDLEAPDNPEPPGPA
jgi:hypothetical protein